MLCVTHDVATRAQIKNILILNLRLADDNVLLAEDATNQQDLQTTAVHTSIAVDSLYSDYYRVISIGVQLNSLRGDNCML